MTILERILEAHALQSFQHMMDEYNKSFQLSIVEMLKEIEIRTTTPEYLDYIMGLHDHS